MVCTSLSCFHRLGIPDISDVFSLSTLLPSHVTWDILHNLPFVYIMLILVLVNDPR